MPNSMKILGKISLGAALSALLSSLSTPSPTIATETLVVSNLSEFPYDGNSHLASHLFVYPSSCADLIEAEIEGTYLHHHVAVAVDGDAAIAIFGDKLPSSVGQVNEVKQCPAVCLERGVDASLVSFAMPYRYWDPASGDENHESISRFVSSLSCGHVEFGFVNYYEKPTSLSWVNPSTNQLNFLYSLGRLEKNTRFIHTFIGHRFVVTDPDSGEVLLDHVVEYSGIIGIGNHLNAHRERDIRKEVRSTMEGEWKKHLMVKRTFSSLGFSKGKLPKDVFASMRAFYYNNRDPPHRLLEEWGGKGLYVNYWETDCNFMQIPWELKHRWQKRLKDLVEAWAGVELEQTDMYGLRQYEVGARLLTHVDRINTHAASMIVNIAQGNLTSPWTVEVYDHADRLHEVVMDPGDVVYYESAKSLHGRNTPLAGGFYANLFTHYRPVGDPQWYLRENPEGTPEPLMDIGKCELVGKLGEYSIGAVKCENEAIGPHLSPTMFTATSGEDLYQWWLSVGPAFKDMGADEL